MTENKLLFLDGLTAFKHLLVETDKYNQLCYENSIRSKENELKNYDAKKKEFFDLLKTFIEQIDEDLVITKKDCIDFLKNDLKFYKPYIEKNMEELNN